MSNTPDPQYGFQLCSADDPQRTHYTHHRVPGAVWIDAAKHWDCCPANYITWRKPIATGPDGMAWAESEWEMVPGNEKPKAGNRFNQLGGWSPSGPEVDYTETASDWCREYNTIRAFARRKPVNRVDPGHGWRLLDKGETIREGDEWHGADGSWNITEQSGDTFGVSAGAATVYRRRTESKPEPPAHEWVSVKKSKPILPCLVSKDESGERWIIWNTHPACTRLDFTHWRPLPAPPPPPKSDAEIAWEKHNAIGNVKIDETTEGGKLIKGAFIAGFEARGGAK
jgi:hypothetical protein